MKYAFDFKIIFELGETNPINIADVVGKKIKELGFDITQGYGFTPDVLEYNQPIKE